MPAALETLEAPGADDEAAMNHVAPDAGMAQQQDGGVSMNTDARDVVATIEQMYAAMGENDRARLHDVLCEDFYAFESGIRMSGPELLGLMGMYYAQGKRYRWSVTSQQVEVQGDLGVAVYVNVGSVIEAPGAEPVSLSWLETALLRRQGGRWRVAFLHSTRAKAAQSAS